MTHGIIGHSHNEPEIGNIAGSEAHLRHRHTVVYPLRAVVGLMRERESAVRGLRSLRGTRIGPTSHTPECFPLAGIFGVITRVMVHRGVLHDDMIVNQSIVPIERNTALKQVVGTTAVQIGALHHRTVAHTVFCIDRIAVDTLHNPGINFEFQLGTAAAGIVDMVGERDHRKFRRNNLLARCTDLDIVNKPSIRTRGPSALREDKTDKQLSFWVVNLLEKLLQIEAFLFPHLVIHRHGGSPIRIRLLAKCGKLCKLATAALVHVVVRAVQCNPGGLAGTFHLDIAHITLLTLRSRIRVHIRDVHELQQIEIQTSIGRKIYRVQCQRIAQTLRMSHLQRTTTARHNRRLRDNRRRTRHSVSNRCAHLKILRIVFIDLSVRHKRRKRKNQA